MIFCFCILRIAALGNHKQGLKVEGCYQDIIVGMQAVDKADIQFSALDHLMDFRGSFRSERQVEHRSLFSADQAFIKRREQVDTHAFGITDCQRQLLLGADLGFHIVKKIHPFVCDDDKPLAFRGELDRADSFATFEQGKSDLLFQSVQTLADGRLGYK